MPADYASTLTSDELNDVVSYLMRVANIKAGEAVDRTDAFEDP
jgi:hypothetical protein